MSIGSESRSQYAVVMRIVNAAGALVEREHLDIRPALTSTVAADSQQFTPAASDNWSRIGWKRLGDGRRWWIIADYSQIVDPFTDLQPETQYNYLAQLGADLTDGETVSQLTLRSAADAGKFTIGMSLHVEDLNPANPVSFDTSVLSVDPLMLTVQVAPVTVTGNLPALLSRVSQETSLPVQLTCSSPNRAFFNALNFSDPTNVLVS